ncbi:MAG: hypothetical protein HZC38_08555 [Chloroflexi bacterium]|nr:hypothetical protein [Chloroflexota bacterium]
MECGIATLTADPCEAIAPDGDTLHLNKNYWTILMAIPSAFNNLPK